ncbi:hypothetical protein D3C77_640750 [compost metagenome]
MFHSICEMSLDCLRWPFTSSQMAPFSSVPTTLRGWIGPSGADRSKALPISQGRPCFFISPCRSRRVMSRPSA